MIRLRVGDRPWEREMHAAFMSITKASTSEGMTLAATNARLGNADAWRRR
jgi:hypothetical protein